MNSDALDIVRFIIRSDTRVAALKRLFDDGAMTRRTLRNELDASRSTVTRTLNALEDRNWIEKQGRTYRLTPLGIAGTRALVEAFESIDIATELAPFLQSFPIAEYDLDLTAFADAELTAATDARPHAPVREHAKPIAEASSYRAILPALIMQGKDEVQKRIAAGELKTEFVVRPQVAATITDGEPAAAFRDQIAAENLSVYVADSIPPFFLSIVDESLVQIGVSRGDSTRPDVLVQSTHPDVRAWAGELYRDHRSAGRPMTIDDF